MDITKITFQGAFAEFTLSTGDYHALVKETTDTVTVESTRGLEIVVTRQDALQLGEALLLISR